MGYVRWLCDKSFRCKIWTPLETSTQSSFLCNYVTTSGNTKPKEDLLGMEKFKQGKNGRGKEIMIEEKWN